MSSAKTYYLIDFENVNDDGLVGSNTLGPNDYVHLFYTDNAKRINLDTLNTDKPCSFSYHKVPTKSQSLDMHLVSYLGYLIGIHKNQSCKYVIVSKDTDYDNIITFWKGLEKASITRQPQITKAVTTSKPTAPKSSFNTSNAKCDLNNAIQKKLSTANFSNDIINHVASLACKHHNENNAKQIIYNAIISKYGQAKGLNIYNHIKKCL